MAYSFDPSILEAEAGELQAHPEQFNSKTLSQKGQGSGTGDCSSVQRVWVQSIVPCNPSHSQKGKEGYITIIWRNIKPTLHSWNKLGLDV